MYQELLPLVYVRYVDDVGTVVENQQEADSENTLEYLNSKHPTIKFEMGASIGRRFSASPGHGGSNRRETREFSEEALHEKSKQGN